jgi:peptide/nickel transport system permease protein
MALFGESLILMIVVLGLTSWMGVARLTRGQFLSLREQEFVLAARASGLGTWRLITRHLLPNAMAPILVAATLRLGGMILIEAGLSFLGLGVHPPTPTWGNMIDEGRHVLLQAWWISTFPGLAIAMTVIAFNIVGDGLRDALDPRLEKL